MARVSDLRAEDPLATTLVLRHNANVDCVAISSDNSWLVTGSGDGTAQLFDLNIDRLMARARKLVGAELTLQQRQRHLLPVEMK